MNAFDRSVLEAMLREAATHLRANPNFVYGFDPARPGSDRSSTFHYTQAPPPPPRKPSKFDGPDVIDLIRGADGVWGVPAALEPRVRAL